MIVTKKQTREQVSYRKTSIVTDKQFHRERSKFVRNSKDHKAKPSILTRCANLACGRSGPALQTSLPLWPNLWRRKSRDVAAAPGAAAVRRQEPIYLFRSGSRPAVAQPRLKQIVQSSDRAALRRARGRERRKASSLLVMCRRLGRLAVAVHRPAVWRMTSYCQGYVVRLSLFQKQKPTL